MADGRTYDAEELLNRPGTYFNPQTEVMVVVDDSQSVDAGVFNLEEFEGVDWVLVSDDVPVDEVRRDELLETFQTTYQGGGTLRLASDDDDEDLDLDDEPELEPLDEP